MADSPSSNKFLYLIVGAMAAAGVAFGIYYFTEGDGGEGKAAISIGENGVKVDGNQAGHAHAAQPKCRAAMPPE